MEKQQVSCPVCLNRLGGECYALPIMGDNKRFRCDNCGKYRISDTALEEATSNEVLSLNRVERAYFSERMAKTTSAGFDRMLLTAEISEVKARAKLLSPPLQADRLLLGIGEEVLNTGSTLPEVSSQMATKIRAVDPTQLGSILYELYYAGLVKGCEVEETTTSPYSVIELDLTLDGWSRFEALKRGKTKGRKGFIAMKFNDERLESFIRDFLKPFIIEHLGIELLDVRDVSRAGVIDNIMREAIRESAFVLSDLTHDNNGAYWEGGFAEGVGKPVIYICERDKFDRVKTHFDTNHSTTVVWHEDEAEKFGQELIATIKRSID